MKQSGVGGSADTAAAFQSDIAHFEKPSDTPGTKTVAGPNGYEGDLSRGSTFIDTVTPALEKMDTAAEKHTKSITDHVSTSLSASDKTVQSHSEAIEKALDKNLGTAVTTGTKHGTDFSNEVEKFITKSKSDVDKIAPDLPKPIATSLNTLVDDADKYGGDSSTKVQKHMEDAGSYVEEEKPKLNTAGRDTLEGLLEGLESMEGPLQAEAQKIANNIESTIRQALQTHSPSEVMANVGVDLVAGLSLGMQRSEHALNETALRVGAGVASALGSGSGGSSGASSAAQPIHLENIILIDGQKIGRVASQFLLDQLKVIGKTRKTAARSNDP